MAKNKESRGEDQADNRGESEENKAHGSSKRGLASADKETRERVARAGGKAAHKGGESGNEKKGGGSPREFPLL